MQRTLCFTTRMKVVLAIVAVALAALCLPALAWASDVSDDASAGVLTSGAWASGSSGEPSDNSVVYTQGGRRGTYAPIRENQAYSRYFKTNAEGFRFTATGGTYTLTVNNNVKKGFMVFGVWLGYKDPDAYTKYVAEGGCTAGKNTISLGRINKGAVVNVMFTNGMRGASEKYSFKVARGITQSTLTSKNTSITVKNASKIKWTGSKRTPAVTVKYTTSSGSKILKKGTQYTVSYSNNVNIGTGVITITGKGQFKGTVKKKFTIKPKGYIYAAAYGGAKGGSPSSSPQMKLMYNTFKKLKVPGYKLKKVLYDDQRWFDETAFKDLLYYAAGKATSNDLVFVYVNAHGLAYVDNKVYKIPFLNYELKGKQVFLNSPGISTANGHCTWKHLLDMIGASTKGKVFLATEVCYSGNLVSVVKNHSTKNRMTIFAGSSDKRSCMSNFFTKRFASGLTTLGADSVAWGGNVNGKVTAQEIASYIKRYMNIAVPWQAPKFYSPNKSFVLRSK